MKPYMAVAALGLLVLVPLSAPQAVADEASPAAGARRAASQDAPLSAAVRSAVKKGDFSEAARLLKAELSGVKVRPDNPAALRAATLLELIRETGEKQMNEFAAISPQRRRFLAAFALDGAWTEMYLSCGLVPHETQVGLDVLYRIYQAERGKVRNKKLAVALASAWGGGETDPHPGVLDKDPDRYNPVRRYNFFMKQQAAGKLHRNYGRLQPWELRFVVGIPWQDWDDRSFTWAAENINMPPDQYDWSCWAAIYTDPSLFGDSVQSGEYTLPFSGESMAEMTQRNGGVCGALSHLGTYAAMAHGIPAYTCGQPGHCAYAVRPERGKWIGGFGGPDGGMHNRIFGNTAPTSFMLMEAVFADDAKVQQAYRAAFCARALEATGDVPGALAMWQQALRATPLHPFMRTQLHRLMKQQGLTPAAAAEYLGSMLPLYKGNGFAAAEMVDQFVNELKAMDAGQRNAVFAKLHEVIADTPSSWAVKIDPVLDSEARYYSEAELPDYLASVLACHMNTGDGAALGQLLEWCIRRYVEKDQAETFNRIFEKAASLSTPMASKSGSERAGKISQSLAKAVISAENARSVLAFQTISDVADKLVAPQGAGKQPSQMGQMRGTLVPPTGLVRVSTTSNWDSPLQHRGILTPAGGHFHTAAENRPNVIVELAEGGELTGCLVRKVDGYEGRMKRAAVYTSSDGATWFKRAETENMPKEWAVQFPDGTSAKWVKVEFDNGADKNFAHLSHVLIYKK